ncbi:hypothetical protein BC826DRAFT_1024676, partial [Russula brevipes]
MNPLHTTANGVAIWSRGETTEEDLTATMVWNRGLWTTHAWVQLGAGWSHHGEQRLLSGV